MNIDWWDLFLKECVYKGRLLITRIVGKKNGIDSYPAFTCVSVLLSVSAPCALFRAGERTDLFFVLDPLELPYRPFFGDAVDPVDALIIALP